MDLDAYVGAHHGQWRRLDDLVSRHALSGAEADELLDLYQRVSTHLSAIRTTSPDPQVIAYLSSLLARARLRTAGAGSSSWRDLVGFFTRTFPAALYRSWRWWTVTSVACLLLAVLAGVWAAGNPAIFTSQMSKEEIDAFVGTDFENYYSEYAHTEFAGQVWTNNAWVAAQAIAYGVLGLPTLYVLAMNSVNVGLAGALMVTHGRGALFFGLILPHGLLELTAIFVAGGTGLRLFWSWVAPGPRTRMQAFAAQGRTAIAIVLGLVVVLLVSGVIEGFVTPSGLPTWARIAIGVLAEGLFLAYVFVVGRGAARRGFTGDVGERQQGYAAPLA
ncbi:MAG: stage II sporulation protein M [Dermatophilaceae bacterium]